LSNILLESKYYKHWYENVNIRESTKKSYSSQLKKFGDFIMSHHPKRELNFDEFYFIETEDEYEPFDEEFIDHYIEYLVELGYSDATLYSNITVMKNFFTYLKATGLIRNNPLRHYGNPYYNLKARDRSFNLEEIFSLLNSAHKLDPFFKQYYVLFFLLFTCGLRAQEICKLRKSQLKFDFNTIEITRGQKTTAGVVIMMENVKEYILNYLNHPTWKEWSGGDDKELFFFEGEPLNRTRLLKMVQRVYDKANIKRKVRLHDFRYSTAFLMYKSGFNLATIQQQLRHARIETTLHYLPPSEELRNALETLSSNSMNSK
jgi:site-specific recombinase XerD